MRNYHRWISVVCMVFLGWVALTGALLALDELTQPAQILFGPDAANPSGLPAGSSNAAPGADAESPLSAAQIVPPLAALLRTALEKTGGVVPENTQVQLQLHSSRPLGVISWRGSAGRVLTVDATTGTTVSQVNNPALSQPGNPAGADAYTLFRNRLHFFLKDLHSGAIVGLGGQLLDLLTGLAFIGLSVTGIMMYVDMLRARRRTGRTDLFWAQPQQSSTGAHAAMRNVHRWGATVGAVLLAYVAVTGTSLQFDELVGGKPLPPNAGIPGGAGATADLAAEPLQPAAEVGRRVEAVLNAVLVAAPDAHPREIDLQFQLIDGRQQATVDLIGGSRRVYTANADTGQIVALALGGPPASVGPPGPGQKLPFWAILQDLHSMGVLGVGGYALDTLTGIAFVTLAVTGTVMYFRMLAVRRRSGRTRMLWR